MIQRAPLPALGHGIRVGTQVIGFEAREVLALTLQSAHVRPENVVG